MTRLTEIRDEIMRRHVRVPDAGADGEDVAIAAAISDFYETAKGIEAASDWVSECLACRHDECTPQGCAYVYSGGEPCNCDPLQRARLHAAGVRVTGEAGLRERLAVIEHDQWMTWAGTVMARERLSPERVERWMRFMVPYADLDEATKDFDREWADKVLAALGDPSVRVTGEAGLDVDLDTLDRWQEAIKEVDLDIVRYFDREHTKRDHEEMLRQVSGRLSKIAFDLWRAGHRWDEQARRWEPPTRYMRDNALRAALATEDPA